MGNSHCAGGTDEGRRRSKRRPNTFESGKRKLWISRAGGAKCLKLRSNTENVCFT